MKLSRLVAYARHLDQFDTTAATSAMVQHLLPVLHTVRTHELQFHDFADKLDEICSDVQTNMVRFDQVLIDLRKEIAANIEAMEPQYLKNSYDLYSQGMINDSNEHILDRRPNLTSDVENYIRTRIMRHSDWHYPGMIIRPGLEQWIADLVALDPLYLVDINMDIMRPAMERFNVEYQNRLRCSVIRESMEDVMLKNLPQGQMSLILVYNFFNYKPLELIRCFLAELYHCLRPGGSLMFTFNNCDRAGGVELCERYFMCYTPGRLILTAAEVLGFQITHTYDIDAAATWVELRRPGELSSLRGGQALARIVAHGNKS
jgi:hypothetical protein